MNRRSFLGTLLAAAVSAVARISPLVERPTQLPFRGIPTRKVGGETLWYRDDPLHPGGVSVKEAGNIVDMMREAMRRIEARATTPTVFYVSRRLYEQARSVYGDAVKVLE